MEHVSLKERISELSNFQAQHAKLIEVVSTVFAEEEAGAAATISSNAVQDINEAYAIFLSINVLDVSKEGTEAWKNARKTYDMKIDRIESQITSQLRDKMAAAASTSEMFRVFAKFNVLFARPRIRGAMQEYQKQILGTIKKDIMQLREKFVMNYEKT